MNYSGYPTIEIDASKCTIPFACKKCLEICPQAVFQTYGIKVEKGRETDPNEPGSYGLSVAYQDSQIKTKAGNVRERAAGIKGEGRKNWKDLISKVLVNDLLLGLS